ncbi:kinase-like domain-containing protein [Dendryphion nanum]|uniref:non-specific serine/threonine protein kinase n=1 Tax=Dendryphion nanum TaxID=256645 RepID=A0A9P9IEE9_9PLEO|nr:kinase-like domain-containing protein [Dendryphion nanum]
MATSNHTSNFPSVYKVLRSLGHGGGGMNDGILIVRNRQTNEVQVEKKLDRKLMARDERYNEIGILIALDRNGLGHKNITRMLSFLAKPQLSFASVWIEYCDLGSMSGMINHYRCRQEWVAPEFAWHILNSLARAVNYCHYGPLDGSRRHNWNMIIHHDIKPDNVFLQTIPGRSWPRVKLGDFGAAEMLTEQNPLPQGGLAMTPGFVPPEAREYIGPENDIWAVGAVMHCVLTLKQVPEMCPALACYSTMICGVINSCMHPSYRGRIRSSDLPWVVKDAQRQENYGRS